VWPFSRKAPTVGPASPEANPADRRRPVPESGPSSARSELGTRGETLARNFLKKLRYKVLGENYRCPSGEIDLITLDPTTLKVTGAETIVFVEVKTRSPGQAVAPQAAVNSAKQHQIKSAAGYYLRTHDAEGFATRYDIVAIVLADGQEPQIEHLKNAFE
jgi:putative endonuclease